MARYFDPSVPGDLALIQPAKWQAATALAAIALRVEGEVIDHYSRIQDETSGILGVCLTDAELAGFVVETFTQPVGTTNRTMVRRVFLLGFQDDPTDAAVPDGLKQAMKLTVAETTVWRLAQWERGDLAVRYLDDKGGRRSGLYEFSPDAWPPSWTRHLLRYDITPKTGIM